MSYTRLEPTTQRPELRTFIDKTDLRSVDPLSKKWVCKYCHSKNNKEDNNCPHCGASGEL